MAQWLQIRWTDGKGKRYTSCMETVDGSAEKVVFNDSVVSISHVKLLVSVMGGKIESISEAEKISFE